MRAIEVWIFAYVLNSLWQVPLVFCAALAAGRLARTAGERMEHRVWVSALLLESLLPLCHFHLGQWLQQAWAQMPWLRQGAASQGEVQVLFGAGTAHGVATPWFSPGALAAIAVVYLCGLLYFAVRLCWGVRRTGALLWRSESIAIPGEVWAKLDLCAELFRVDRDSVRVAGSGEISGPATVGVWRHTILLPGGFIDQVNSNDLESLLAHEFAHIQRKDFAKNLLYGILALPIAYHPLLALTRARIAETRELVCDAMAVDAFGEREKYARSLLRMASLLAGRATPGLLHAIGILDANIFERRVMNLTRKAGTIGRTRRSLIVAACGVIALATCISAVSLQADEPAAPQQLPTPKKVVVSAGVMEAMLLTRVAPVYPDLAKAAKVQGTVVLRAVVGKDGQMKNLVVTSGPKMLQEAALDAAKQWTYKPYLLNGNPVDVETTINITFSLPGKTAGKKSKSE